MRLENVYLLTVVVIVLLVSGFLAIAISTGLFSGEGPTVEVELIGEDVVVSVEPKDAFKFLILMDVFPSFLPDHPG